MREIQHVEIYQSVNKAEIGQIFKLIDKHSIADSQSKEDYSDQIKELLDTQENEVDSVYKNKTPVFYAIFTKNTDALKLIIASRPEVLEMKNKFGITPVFYAIDTKNLDALRTIIETNPEVLEQSFASAKAPVFYAIFTKNTDALKVIIASRPEALQQIDSYSRTPVFYAIDTKNLDAFKTIIETNPEVLEQKIDHDITPVFYAIDTKNLDALRAIIETNPEVLEQKIDHDITPVFYAIANKNFDAFKAIIETNPEVLGQKIDHDRTPVFYAIDANNIDAFKAIIETNPEVLEQKIDDGRTPIFYAIDTNNFDAFKAIIETNPEILEQKIDDGRTPVFYAIDADNFDAFKAIIETNPEVLDQKIDDGRTPVFYAIDANNFDAFKAILEKSPEEINMIENSNLNVFDYSIKNYLTSIHENDLVKQNLAKSILNLAFQKQFETTKEISDDDLEIILKVYKKLFHLKLAYGNSDYICEEKTKLAVYKEIIEELKSLKPQNQFIDFGLEAISSIDKIDKPIETEQEKLYIFTSKLNGHCSYFIFHVDKVSNKVTDISYCDGNRITKNDELLKNSKYLKGGVRKFKIESEIEFSKEFVNDFLRLNSEDKDFQVFYKQLEDQGLKVDDPLNPESTKIFTSNDFLIPVKAQSKGNCGYKSLKILWRYVAKSKNEEIDFSSRHIDMISRKFDSQSQSISDERFEDVTDGTAMFKDFKGELTIGATKEILEFKESLKNNSTPETENVTKETRNYLLKKIDNSLEILHQKSSEKLKAKKKESMIHQKINEISEIEITEATCLLPLAKRNRVL